jgi:hypothetical protein
MKPFGRVSKAEWVLVPAFVVAFTVGAGTGVTFAAFTTTASSAGPTITTKRIFPIARGGPAWQVTDFTGGGAGVVSDAPLAINNDNRFPTTAGAWPVAFSAAAYLEFDMNAPLPGGQPVTGANFNYSWRTVGGGGSTTCYYFETRNGTTNAVIATHGSSAAPVACTTTGATVVTALPELTSSDLANGARVRVYHRNSAGVGSDTDIATITGSALSAFTLYPNSMTDMSVASPGVVTPWSLKTADGISYTSASNLAVAYSATRYLQLTYPAYVQAGTTVTGATFTHTFRDAGGAGGPNACFFIGVYTGVTLLATHGSQAVPYCNATAAYATTVIPLPEIDTIAEGNSVVVRIYEWTPGGTRKILEDQASVSVTSYMD